MSLSLRSYDHLGPFEIKDGLIRLAHSSAHASAHAFVKAGATPMPQEASP